VSLLLNVKFCCGSQAFDISPPEMFWRQIGGHLWRVESCTAGVTWGIGYDCVPWVYTGGWGGSFLKGTLARQIYFNLKKK